MHQECDEESFCTSAAAEDLAHDELSMSPLLSVLETGNFLGKSSSAVHSDRSAVLEPRHGNLATAWILHFQFDGE
jgi:hypothetical protein